MICNAGSPLGAWLAREIGLRDYRSARARVKGHASTWCFDNREVSSFISDCNSVQNGDSRGVTPSVRSLCALSGVTPSVRSLCALSGVTPSVRSLCALSDWGGGGRMAIKDWGVGSGWRQKTGGGGGVAIKDWGGG